MEHSSDLEKEGGRARCPEFEHGIRPWCLRIGGARG